jgi:hypothetical protein
MVHIYGVLIALVAACGDKAVIAYTALCRFVRYCGVVDFEKIVPEVTLFLWDLFLLWLMDSSASASNRDRRAREESGAS